MNTLWIVVGLIFGIVWGGLAVSWKRIKKLEVDHKALLGWAHKEHLSDKEHDAWSLETIQALCPHEEWDYSTKEVTVTRLYSHGLTEQLSYAPRRYTYHKTCKVCTKKIEIDKAKYDAGLKAIEVADIEKAQAKLNTRQKAVREES